jgi:hypothetical protein
VTPERGDQMEALARIAEAAGHTVTPSEGSLVIQAPTAYAAQLNRSAMQAGITLVEIKSHQATLEDTFLSMIGEPDSEGGQ